MSLDDLADAVDSSVSTESYVDIATGTVWPGDLPDLGEGPDGLGQHDSDRWLFVGGMAYSDMEWFIDTVQQAGLNSKLRDAISRNQPFKKFLTVLQDHGEQVASWHRHRDDARLGRARHWLASRGYEPTHT